MPDSPPPLSPVDDTVTLLAQARQGDPAALDLLFARHVPLLKRWARGRLPRWARDVTETSDLVQDTVLATFQRLDRFEVRGDGALQAYLRQAFINRVRSHLRKVGVRPLTTALDPAAAADDTSPLDAAIGSEAVERYEAALARLRPEDREAIVTRIEFDLTFEELARALGKPSADAARMAVVRALVRLAEEMDRLVE